MSDVVKVLKEIAFEMNAEDIARAFSDLDDDAQAQFFVHVARNFKDFPGGYTQTLYIGHHLRDCKCSTEEAREWVKDLANCMTGPPRPHPLAKPEGDDK
jgi:hypothetical protein